MPARSRHATASLCWRPLNLAFDLTACESSLVSAQAQAGAKDRHGHLRRRTSFGAAPRLDVLSGATHLL
jgi:hypothetical protein